MSTLELAAAGFSLTGVWLTTRRSVWCWPVGLIAVLLYGVVFLAVRLYSDALLQVIYLLLQIYGWHQWRCAARGAARDAAPRASTLAVRAGTPRERALPLLLALPAAALLGWLMAAYTRAAAPWLDAALMALSLVAQFWLARRIRWNWLLWVGVDLVYVGLYWRQNLPATAALYVAFVVLAVYGWRAWGRTQPDSDEPASPTIPRGGR